jgi:pimeloyl-ACP methyl ester carboxylesterase
VGEELAMSMREDMAAGPPLPYGRRIELPGRGITFVRDVPGPTPDAPTVLLLHGWIASAGLNWFQAFDALGEHYRVVALDQRGHARGLRSRKRFRLADCADDAAALLDELEIPSAVAVGYSMGGPIAQLLWRRHPEKVSGLVLCATATGFVPVMRERFIFTASMAALAGTTRVGQWVNRLPSHWVRQLPLVSALRTSSGRPSSLQRWASAEMRRHDPRLVLEAGAALGNYNAKRWIGEVDVPTSILVTTEDRAIVPARQLEMAEAIPGATVHELKDGHVACMRAAFAAPLVVACDDVARRVAAAA